MADKNYFSISQGVYTMYSGTPNVIIVTSLPDKNTFLPVDAKTYSDILKFSNQQNFTLDYVKVAQGIEDSVDINNRCSNLNLHGEFGRGGGGNQVFTIKGGSTNITISGLVYGNRVEIGDWSDQCYNHTENIILDLRSSNYQPIDVIIGRGRNITLKGNCKKKTLDSLLLTSYWWIKWLVRKILGIKVGEQGPSWL